LSDTNRFMACGCLGAALAALLWLGPSTVAFAQDQGQGEAASSSKGENFSAKPAAQLFASDCTGAGCHKGPQGLAKAGGVGLAGFLREHYTNSRESAAALASYLSKLPNTTEPKEKEGRAQRTARPAPPSSPPSWGAGFGFPSSEPGAVTRPEPKESKTSRQTPNSRTSRAPARPEESAPEKPTAAATHASPEPPSHDGSPKAGANARAAQHMRPPEPAAAPMQAAPEPPPPPPAPAATAQAPSPPPAKQYGIFD
jgi:hypothetical protein